MGGQASGPRGPDLTSGIAVDGVPDGGMIVGHVGEENVLVARRGGEVFAVGATCTHYGGPLDEGIVAGAEVRCPWHHACFSLRTGEAVKAPALAPIDCWQVEHAGGRVTVREKRPPAPKPTADGPESVVIVGAGAAGAAAADMLRREGYQGAITMLAGAGEPPVDRPNLSKDYLAGNAPEEWIPLRPPEGWAEQRVTLVHERATAIDTEAHRVTLADGRELPYGALLLATGADPIQLKMPGGDRIRYLRTLADSRAIIAEAGRARRALVIGASFIGLEVAASLRTRGLEVHVVAPEARPLERILGPELGDFVRDLHETKGVNFHLGKTVQGLGENEATLSDGSTLPAELVVAGIGVRPSTELAEKAGLITDRGVLVDVFLGASAPDVWAAGDVARYPEPRVGEPVRIEHWVVAERQGQTAARNILGQRRRFDDVPFFWSAHYDVTIAYVGHAPRWDRIQIDGDLAARDAKVTYSLDGKTLAVATVFRDRESLLAELELEKSATASAP